MQRKSEVTAATKTRRSETKKDMENNKRASAIRLPKKTLLLATTGIAVATTVTSAGLGR